MSAIAAAVSTLAAEIAGVTATWGKCVTIDPHNVLDRRGMLPLAPPGLRSPNGSCGLMRAADGWIAVNLARRTDWDVIPAWLGIDGADFDWETVESEVTQTNRQQLIQQARLLGLPVAAVAEMEADRPHPLLIQHGHSGDLRTRLNVVDLSALWAGPLCGGILAAAGAFVTKVESKCRPDTTRFATPALYRRLNGEKKHLCLAFDDPHDIAVLRHLMIEADMVITSARPRAFDSLGLSPQHIFERNPTLTWVAISGYGWVGEDSDRVAFGDDAAAAGGLVQWPPGRAPHFVGDAIADPLTGMAAALGALKSVGQGGGYIVDAALARTAAGVAAMASD
jgi:CoA-transferase family III